MKPNQKKEMLIITAMSIPLMYIAVNFDLLEKLYYFSRKYEEYEIDEIFVLLLFAAFILFFYNVRNNKKLKTANELIKNKNNELEKVLKEISTLKGMLTICSVCKKIKVDENYWQKIEDYISENSDAQFSHGICMDCANKLYPDIISGKDKQV